MNRLSLLATGMAVFGLAQAAQTDPAAFELALVDMQGQKKVLATVPGTVFSPRVSPDGTRVAFEQFVPAPSAEETDATQLFVARLDNMEQRVPLEVTIITRRNTGAVWSPESDWVAFLAEGNGADSIFWQRADGSIQPKFLVDGQAAEGLYENGRLVFSSRSGATGNDYGISQLDINTRKVTRLVDQPGSAQLSSDLSPDESWIAYTSNETGRQEVWVEPLPANGQRFQVTRQGGSHPQWSPDGAQLYYGNSGRMYRIDITVNGGAARAGEPVQLPITGFQQGELRRQYDLTPDGKGFLMLFPTRSGQ